MCECQEHEFVAVQQVVCFPCEAPAPIVHTESTPQLEREWAGGTIGDLLRFLPAIALMAVGGLIASLVMSGVQNARIGQLEHQLQKQQSALEAQKTQTAMRQQKIDKVKEVVCK